MTNINQISDTAQPLTAPNSKTSKSASTDAFGDALNKAFDKTQVKEMMQTPANALSEIASSGLNIIHSSDIVSGKTDKLLEMLDQYSLQLQDPTISLKNIAPVLEEIKSGAGALLKETQNLTAADDGLKKIATQTIVTAQTEYLKFQRGDYLS